MESASNDTENKSAINLEIITNKYNSNKIDEILSKG
jgi:hypothetical protein